MSKITLKPKFLSFFLILSGILFMNAQEYVPFTPRLDGDNIQIRGDVVFVGNNIMNRASEANPEEANTPYNGTDNNNSLWMEYIDIDSDTDTFSSSSAELNITNPECSKVRYAGLYWAGTYPNERSNSSAQFDGTPRIEEWNEIKFKIPGGTYVDLIADTNADPAGEEDDIIMNGYQPANPTVFAKDAPVICYKNITDLVNANANPNGEYTAANIRATRGRRNGSSSAGWVMVIIYENPTETGKFISTFDGYASLSGSVGNVDVLVDGFKTLPTPFNVNARIGVAALEGDNGITNDRFTIEASSTTSGFTDLEESFNPNNNFFNSTITTNGLQVPTRTPYGTNTLGLDLDLIELNNPTNSVLPNDETTATLRFTSSGDGYGAFLAVFSVVIIEPEIVLEKKVREFGNSDPLTNDITGQGVNLSDDLIYELSFKNVGNDDITNYSIRDVMPINTSFIDVDLDGAPGVTYSHDPIINEIIFNIPDNLVLQDGPNYTIRIHVKVAENCFDFVDACSDLIENTAYSTYQGVENMAIITDDPSVSDFDDCGFVTPGATNFLLDDLAACNFTRTAELCSDSLTLTAGSGFDEYIWVRDENGNNTIDSADTILLNGGPTDNNFTVSSSGTYIVDKIVADPCKGFQEIIVVQRFGTTQTNPIVDFFNDSNSDTDPDNDIQGEITNCSIDGREIANIFLCGANDSQSIPLIIPDADSISWEKLNETSCAITDPSCPVTNGSCYDLVSTDTVFDANSAGYYRVVINYDGGCNSTFYFNVFQNELEVIYPEPRDIICDTPGNITITNLGNSYGYQLFDVTNDNIAIPFSDNNGPSFDIQPGDGGAYRVDVVQLDTNGDPIEGACIFQTDNIEILDRNFQVDLSSTPANCNSLGAINIQALNVSPDYFYEIRLNDGTPPPSILPYPEHPGGTLVDDETAQSSNNFTFNNLNPDDYFVITKTDDGCVDVQEITVTRDPDPTISAVTTRNIGCVAGTIVLTPDGGPEDSDYFYAIWSKDGTILHHPGGSPTEQEIVNNFPGSAYSVDSTFYFGYRDDNADGDDEYIPNEDGEYVFLIVDDNNCYALSNPVTIEDIGVLSITSIDEVQPSCSGDADGSLTINITNGTTPFLYSIDGGTTTQSTPTFAGLTAGTYTINVTDDAGCDVSQPYVLGEPFPFSASAGVSRDVSCNPSIGAEVRITNVVGGTPPYTFSFDSGATFGTVQTADLLPGTHNLIARDANCDFPMTVIVEDLPTEPLLTLTPQVEYNCDGTGTIIISSDIDTYNYTYEIDDVFNSPDPTSNTFSDLPTRNTPYKITTNYMPQTSPVASVLLVEDFGYGPTIPNANTSSAYAYESQIIDGIPSGSTKDGTGTEEISINDFEYAVTSHIERPFGSWFSPVDHTSGDRATEGRYLAVNLGDITDGETIYEKAINDIIPNQDLEVSLWAINLVRANNNLADPNLTIELRHPITNAVIASANTGFINETDNWINYTIPLNPGTNTALNLIITSTDSVNNGCDVAFDDILVEQTPEICELSIDTYISIEPGNLFSASGTSHTDVSCNGLTDGTITFSVENFDITDGFQYSVDGINGTYITSTTSPVTTAAVFGAGSQTIHIRRTDDFSCATSVTRTISEPDAIVASGSITTVLTCDTNATITASATGGIAPYHYQLQDAATDIAISGYDFTTNTTNTVFSNLSAGTYEIVVMDRNGTGTCPDVSDIITITQPTVPTFTATPTLCYSGNSDGSITVIATGGNGDYQFKINSASGNPWVSPNTGTPNTYTFTNLSEGTYTIDVKDSLGCDAVQETGIIITPALSISATAADITACATSTNLNITASGGVGTLVFAYATVGNTPANADFSTTNPIAITAAGTYDVFVRDNNNNAGAGGTVGTDFCQETFRIVIAKDDPISATPTPTHITCNGDTNGAIAIGTVTGGEAPFTYTLDDGVTSTDQPTPDFNNLAAGNYTVQITDANGCQLTTAIPVIINQPNALTADTPIVSQALECPSVMAQITVSNPLGGSNSYQYSLNGGTWTTATTGGYTFTGLSANTYTIRMRDTNAISCSITLPNVTVDPLPTPPTISNTITYNCDGTGNVTIIPFDANYTYTIGATSQTGVGANVFNNIAVGNHTISVAYGSNCSVTDTASVQAGNEFNAAITTFTNPTCIGLTDGTITISAENFGAGGFEYRLNDVGGTNPFIGPFTATEQITNLSGIAYTIEVRDFDNAAIASPLTGCAITLNQTLTTPTAVVASASITSAFSCNTTGATITATAGGGTPTYVYQLEDTGGTPFSGYDFSTNGNNTVFSNLGADTYIVRARDLNSCEDIIDTAITIVAPVNPTFTATPTACYTGNNDGSIIVDVTSLPGNGNFQFSINGSPYVTPGTTSHTFTNLANGSYTVDVRDGFGCEATQQTVSINPNLSATIDINDVTCTDGTITVNATGGDGIYQYAFITPSGTTVTDTDFVTSNTITVNTTTTYDIYVRDNDNNSGLGGTVGTDFCQYVQTETVNTRPAIAITTTPNQPQCFNENGSIDLTINTGNGPYTLQIFDGVTTSTVSNFTSTTHTFFNLSPGTVSTNYTITVTDAYGCTTATTETITNPIELTAEIQGIAPVNCDPNPNLYGFTFINYPTTIGTLEFSADGGTTWLNSDSFTGILSGTEVEPSIRTISGGIELCRTDLPRYTIPYPLDDLDISISAIIVDCNDLQVTVQGTEGLAPYEYTYSDDPVNFDPSAATWHLGGTINSDGNSVLSGHGTHVFTGLVPGRTYVFYVRDSSPCVRQSSQNVNALAPPPVTIDGLVTPTCDGVNNGQITYTVTENNPGELGGTFDWELFRVDNPHVSITTGTEAGFTSGDSFTVPTPASLATGDYFVEIRGAAPNNCIIGSENVLLEQLDPITFTPNVLRDITCATSGVIEIQNPQGGGGMYTYTLSSTNFTLDIVTTDNPIEIPISNLVDPTATPFDILVEIADQYNCPVTTLPIHTVSIAVSQSPTIGTITTTNCTSPFSFTVPVTGGAAPYFYSNDGGSSYVNNGGVFSNVAVGTYAISVIDANGCTATNTVEIFPVLEASATPTKLIDCTSAPNGEITITATGGSGSFEYEISGPVNQTRIALPSPANSIVWNLASTHGTYTVSLYDVNKPSCPAITIPVEIVERLNPILSIDPLSVSNETCDDSDNGSFTVSALDNNSGPFTFAITASSDALVTVPINPTSSTDFSATFSDLTGETGGTTYTVTATSDTNDCEATINQIITEPQPVVVPTDNIEIVQFACTTGNNDNNASITVNPSVTTPSVSNITGGSGNYVRYEFFNNLDLVNAVQDGSNNTYIETNLLGGNYTINVYDDNGCVGTTTATINPFDQLLTVDATNTITCNPTADGEITITFTSTTNNAALIEYSDDNGVTYQSSNIFNGLAVGTYDFLVRHTVTRCILPVSETIVEPNTFEIDITGTTNVTCSGDANGSVTFTITDATYTGNYSWSIFDDNDTPTNFTDDGAAIDTGDQTTLTSTILPAGSYYISVTQDGVPTCGNMEVFNIAEPPMGLSADRRITGITCNPTDNGIIEIFNIQGGWGNYKYYVSTTPIPDEYDDTNYVTNPRFENLVAGTYEVWVIDEQGCPLQLTDAILANPTPILADLQITQQNCTDFDGIIEVVGIPATDPVSGGQGSNYSYQLIKDAVAFGAPQTTTTFNGLGAGDYTLTITDQWGCTFTTPTAVTLFEPIVPEANIIKAIDCNTTNPGGTINITQTGGSGTSYTYEITAINATPLGTAIAPTTSTATTASFTGLTTIGTYTFTITDDAIPSSCSKTIIRELVEAPVPTIAIDNATNVTCNGLDDGTITVSVTDNGLTPYTFEITAVDGVVLGTPINSTTNTATTATFENLEPTNGTGVGYTITVTADNDCQDSIDHIITEPQAIVVTMATPIEFLCAVDAGNNETNASITVQTVAGGSNNYVNYQFFNDLDLINPVQEGIDTTYIETNFAGGNYTIIVTDDKGCTGMSTTSIAPFDELLSAPITQTSILCAGEAIRIDAISLITNFSSHPTNYEFREIATPANVFDADNTFSDLSVGLHSFEVRNIATGCSIIVQHTVENPNTFDFTVDKLSDVICNGTNTGEVTIEITDDVYTGSFNWEIFNTNNTPTDNTDDISITSGSLTPNSITPPINLSAGNYRVSVAQTTDPGCTKERFFSITEFDEIMVNAEEEANPTCSDNQGSILVTPTGGDGPYSITLSNGSGYSNTQTSVNAFLFEGLSGGIYDVEITDMVSCIQNFPAEIELETPELIDPTASIVPLLCYNENTGSISALVNPRTIPANPTYSYELNVYDDTGSTIVLTSEEQGSNIFTGLNAGIYSITVYDDFGCFGTTPLSTIINPDEVYAQLVRTSPLTCATGVELLLTATGGTGPYEYFNPITNTWIAMSGTGGTTQVFPNADYTGTLPAGSYQFMVRDMNQCESILSNAIEEDEILPVELTVDKTAAFISCFGDNTAAIFVDAEEGMGDYRYELFTDASFSASSLIAGPQSDGIFRNLFAGEYYVRVTSGDCNPDSERVVIDEPTMLEVIDPDAFTHVTCFDGNDGTINAELRGGSGDYQYAISPNLNQFFAEGIFVNLLPGTYTIIAEDVNGCFLELDYTINQPELLQASATSMPEICVGDEDGSIELAIQGGTAPYSTRLEHETDFIEGRRVIPNLAAGVYFVFVRDANGCDTNTAATIASGANINATVTPVYECTGDTPTNYINITLEDPTVIGDVLYGLDVADQDNPDINELQLNPDFRNIAPGTHNITITHSTTGCVHNIPFEIEGFEPLTLTLEQNNINEITAVANDGQENYTFYFEDVNNGEDNTYYINRTDTYLVRVVDENGCEAMASIDMEFIDIEIPNFFTPDDGDGLNDFWIPRNMEAFPDILTIIFDRYGREVYRLGLGDPGWNGLYKEAELPTGDYWYVIKLKGENDDREFVGHFTLYR